MPTPARAACKIRSLLSSTSEPFTATSCRRLAEDDFRRSLPRFQQDAQAHNQKLVNQLSVMAAGYDATAAQLALAWVLAKSDFIVPIPGASKIAHLEQNCVAADLTLRGVDVATLDELFSVHNIQGARYNDSEFILVDR